MITSLLLVAVGLVLLVVAAEHFVRGAARLALALQVSPVLVGVVVIGFGTSSPELLVGVIAAARGEVGIAIGSVVGSNIANLTLVAGAAAIVTPLAIHGQVLRRELPLSALGVMGLAAAAFGALTRIEGLVLVGLFAATFAILVRASLRAPASEQLGQEAREFAEASGHPQVGREWLRLALGLLGTLGGAHALVTGASDVARTVGLSEAVIGLTLVAVGTSLPEMVTAIQAARQRETDLIIGNLLGSNLFNSLAIAGTALLIGPVGAAGNDLGLASLIAMVAIMVLAALAMLTGATIRRAEGVALVAVYPLVLLVVAR